MRPTRPTRPNRSTCALCGEPIEWAFTEARQHQPLNVGEDPRGNVAAYRDGPGTLKARVLAVGEQPQHIEKRRMPHAATCTARNPPTAIAVGGYPAPAAPARVQDNVIPLNRRRRTRT